MRYCTSERTEGGAADISGSAGSRGDDVVGGPIFTTDGLAAAAGALVHSTVLPFSRGATKQRVYSSRPPAVVGGAPGR